MEEKIKANISLLKKVLLDAGFSKELTSAVLGNIDVECGFICKGENLNYTTAQSLVRTFPSYFVKKPLAFVQKYVKNPIALADYVYANKGGWKFRGRGFLQFTGKSLYNQYGTLLGINLIANPDLALDETISSKMVVTYIKLNAIPKYTSDNLNNCKILSTVSDIVTKSVQGFGKNYELPFLKEHLQKKREAAKKYYDSFDSY